jgi:hypothetical protein
METTAGDLGENARVGRCDVSEATGAGRRWAAALGVVVALVLVGRAVGAQHGRAAPARPPAWTRFELHQTTDNTNTESVQVLTPDMHRTADGSPASWPNAAVRRDLQTALRNPDFWRGMREGFQCPPPSGSHVRFVMVTAAETLTQDVSGCVPPTQPMNVARRVYEDMP